MTPMMWVMCLLGNPCHVFFITPHCHQPPSPPLICKTGGECRTKRQGGGGQVTPGKGTSLLPRVRTSKQQQGQGSPAVMYNSTFPSPLFLPFDKSPFQRKTFELMSHYDWVFKAKEFQVWTSTDHCTVGWNSVQLNLSGAHCNHSFCRTFFNHTKQQDCGPEGLWAGIGRLEHWLFSEPSAHWVDVVLPPQPLFAAAGSSHGLLCMPGKNRTSLKRT